MMSSATKIRIGASTARGISSTMNADVAEDPPSPDEHPGEHRVPGSGAHPLVRRLPDVGRGLRDAAAHPAIRVATASVSRMLRVLKSSPATRRSRSR